MQAISDLWASRNQKAWSDALARYWNMPSVLKNLGLETRMNKLNSAAIKSLSQQEWYDFLKDEYFPWKYTASHRLASTRKYLRKYEETNSLGELFSLKEKLFAFNPSNIQEGLEIAEKIKGLGWAGASGLLAVLFPKWFGTADQFMVKALCEIESLPEREKLLEMRPEDLKEKDAVLLINLMRRKATDLNALFGTDEWTPRKIDMLLWATRNGADARCLSRTTS